MMLSLLLAGRLTGLAVEAPVSSLPEGEYTRAKSTLVTSGTPGAIVRYSTDGTEVSALSPKASGPIPINRSLELRLQAFVAGQSPSDIVSLIFFITGHVAAGDFHTLALRADGTVWSMGLNESGQLGDGSFVPREFPVQVALDSGPLTGIVELAAGSEHSVALKEDGTVWTWGDNQYGQLGIGSTVGKTRPAQVVTAAGPLSGVVAIACGNFSSYALKSDGSVWSWGWNISGQLGIGSTAKQTKAVQVTGLSNVTFMAASGRHVLAVKSNGSVWSWGLNSNGQLGDGTVVQRNSPVQVTALSGVTAVAAGLNHSLFVKSDGTVWATGSNNGGQLGNGTKTQSLVPVQATVLTDMYDVAAGSSHSVALKHDGTLWIFGDNTYGQIGNGTQADQTTAVQIPGVVARRISAHGNRTVFCDQSGKVWSVGENVYCEFGNGTFGSINVPEAVPVSNVTKVAAGDRFSIFLTQNGTVWSVGRDGSGQLGINSRTNFANPVQVRLASGGYLTGIVAIAAGGDHVLALKNDGTLWAWGNNANGRLGDGTTTTRGRAVQVKASSSTVFGSVAAISAGADWSMALKTDGSLWAWGLNTSQQLGIGSTTEQIYPVQVTTASGTLTNVTAISAGYAHGMAVKSDGTLWVWGSNADGQLGLNSTTSQGQAVQVPGMTSVVGVSAGHWHSLALKSDGSVWGTGNNQFCQLGDNTVTSRQAFVSSNGLTGVQSIFAGYNHSLAIKNGTLLAWGINSNGQLGIQNFTNSRVPVLISNFNNITFASGGSDHTLAVQSGQTPFAWGARTYGQLGDGFFGFTTAFVQATGLLLVDWNDSDHDDLPDDWEQAQWSNLTESGIGDPDGDGLTNVREYQLSGDPKNYYSQGGATITPVVSIVSGNNQAGAPGAFVSNPLVVTITTPQGAPMVNAPVTFTVTQGGGMISADKQGLQGTLDLRTDSSGNAQVYFQQGPVAGATNSVTAQSATSGIVTFTARTTLADGLWSRWKLDEGSGTTAADFTGLTVNGTLTNQPQWSQGFDGRGGMTFTGFQSEGGTNAYVTMGNPTDRSLDFGTDSFSIALWVKYTDGTFPAGQYGRRIISKGHHGFNPGYTIVLEGDGRLWTGIGATQGGASQALFFRTVNEYNDGKWHHVAAVFDRQNSTARIFVDGVAQTLAKDSNTGGVVDSQDPTVINYPALANLSATRTDMPLTISSHLGVYDFFKGDVDDVRFYRKAINAQDVLGLYNTDTDGDGLSDLLESANGFDLNNPDENNNGISDGQDDFDKDGYNNLAEAQQGSNPNDYFSQPDGQGGAMTVTPLVTIAGGNDQDGEPGAYLAEPLSVEVRNSANNALLPTAPVEFTVTSGGGGLAEVSGNTTTSGTLTVFTGNATTGTNGIAEVYYKQEDNSESTIAAQSGTSGAVSFTVHTSDGQWCRWKFDEQSGSNAAESTGHSANGTLMNQTGWTGGFNNQGGVEFSGFASEGGTSAYVTMGNPADRSLDFGTDSFSIALWVKYTDGTFPEGQTGRRIISKGNYGFNTGYTIALEGSGQLYAGIGSSQGTASQALFFHTVGEYNDDTWHHVAVVFDRQNSTARIYVDGVAQELAKDANTGGVLDSLYPTVIAYPALTMLNATNVDIPLTVSSHMGTSDFFKGGVDDIRFYRKALEGPEVEALRNVDSDGDELPDWWEMENGFDPNNPDENNNGVPDGLDDADGDGVNNVTEYRQGRNPRAGAVSDTAGVLDFKVYTRLEN